MAASAERNLPAKATGAPHQPPESIPWDQIGAKAEADCQDDGLKVTATAEGARLDCVFQRMEETQEPFLGEGEIGLNWAPAFFDAKSESKAAVTLATVPTSIKQGLVAGEERWVWGGEMRGGES
jgi:hypothetical protein